VTRRRTHAARGVSTEAPSLFDVADPVSVYEDTGDAFPGASPASAIAVSTLTQIVKDVVEGAFIPLWVSGEVSDFKAHRNGHWYFCLRDLSSQRPTTGCR
jgi:exodeoxyribonuclease VII large subunit